METKTKNFVEKHEEILARLEAYQRENHNGVTCGVAEIDKLFRLQRGQLIIITAKPSCGKSTFLTWFAVQHIQKNGLRFLSFSFENDPSFALAKVTAKLGITKAVDNDHFISYDTTRITSLADLLACIQQYRQAAKIDAVIIDPFNCIPAANLYELNTINGILSALKETAKRLNICVILAAHPTKLTEADRATKYTIAGSADFDRMADVIITMNRGDNHQVEFAAEKVRHHQQGKQGASAWATYDTEADHYTFTPDPLDSIFCESTEQAKQAKTINFFKLMNSKVNVSDIYGHDTQTITLQQALVDLGKEKKNARQIAHIRANRDSMTKQQLRQEKKKLPIFTPCGTFKDGERKAANIDHYNNILCIDIDVKQGENETLTKQEMEAYCKRRGDVFYMAQSVGGKGFFALVAVDGSEGDFSAHFDHIHKEFAENGIIIDTTCSDISRARFISSDPNQYINQRATIHTLPTNTKTTTATTARHTTTTKKRTTNNDKQKAIALANKVQREKINIAPAHGQTLKVLNALKNIFDSDPETGLQCYQKIKGQDGHTKEQMAKEWAQELANGKESSASYGTLDFLYKQAKNNLSKKNLL